MKLTRRSLFGVLEAAAAAKVLPTPTKAERAIEHLKTSPTVVEGWKPLNPPVIVGEIVSLSMPMTYLTTTTASNTAAVNWWPRESIVTEHL